MIAHVVLDVPLAQQFDFLADGCSSEDVGRIVVVPFGRAGAFVGGVIVGFSEASAHPLHKLKPIRLVQRAAPPVPRETIALAQFCADYYHCPLGQVLLNLLPPSLRGAKPWMPKATAPTAYALTGAGASALAAFAATPSKARAVRALLGQFIGSAPLLTRTLVGSRATLSRCLAEGWIEPVDAPLSANVRASPRFVALHNLNPAQTAAITAIRAAMTAAVMPGNETPKPFLLAGITGSGKTEVYLHVIAHALASGAQALVLVPEINLTPALLANIRSRFPDANIIEAHSGMAAGARAAQFIAAQTGAADIVIGTRLAVFTPLPRLGLIVVDEEHDGSFKQQEGVRYHARDLAIFRARQSNCVAVLGSATPSLESIENAARQRYQLLRLATRAGNAAALPSVELVDLNKEPTRDGLTMRVVAAIETTLARGEQALVFINRRGFSPAMVCAQCGWMPHCKQCSARLVFHRGEARMRCHHCGYTARVPAGCAECGNQELIGAGEGSERIESALRAHFPQARIARVDRDAMRRKGSAERVFAAAAKGELDILVGTQMLAKGHDFPRLTLVCIVNSDGAVFSADFRAPERVLAQLVQVAGRAGRADRAGHVLVQTRFVTHPLYLTLQTHDYRAFADSAMEERKFARFPPHGYLAMLRAESEDGVALAAFMSRALELARAIDGDSGLSIWDPVSAPLARKAGNERQQILLQSSSRSRLQRLLGTWLAALRAEKSSKLRWIIDVDPIEV